MNENNDEEYLQLGNEVEEWRTRKLEDVAEAMSDHDAWLAQAEKFNAHLSAEDPLASVTDVDTDKPAPPSYPLVLDSCTSLVLHDDPQYDTDIPLIASNIPKLTEQLNRLKTELVSLNEGHNEARWALEQKPNIRPVVQRLQYMQAKINRLVDLRNFARRLAGQPVSPTTDSMDSDIPVVNVPEDAESLLAKEQTDPQDQKGPSKLKTQRMTEKRLKQVKLLGRKLRRLCHPDTQKDLDIRAQFPTVITAIANNDLELLQQLDRLITIYVQSEFSAEARKYRIEQQLKHMQYAIKDLQQEVQDTKTCFLATMTDLLAQGKDLDAQTQYLNGLLLVEKNVTEYLELLKRNTRFYSPTGRILESPAA